MGCKQNPEAEKRKMGAASGSMRQFAKLASIPAHARLGDSLSPQGNPPDFPFWLPGMTVS